MRLIATVFLALALVGCSSAAPEVTEMPSSQVDAPAAETNDAVDAGSEQTEEAVEQEETEADSSESSEREENPVREEETSEPAPTETKEASPAPTKTQEPSPTPTKTSTGYTLAQVAEKNSQSACWVAIDGMVYDLTEWIRSHPGGRAAILSLCGTDGTSSFLSQHGGQARPSSTLDGYVLGPLVN